MAKILIVEDEQNLNKILQDYLHHYGYQTVSAETGAEAFTFWKEEKPDLILLDLNLPDMDGLDIMREIRKTDTIPIVIVTARDEEIERLIGLELGSDDYISKPFSPREVVARIKAVLRRVNLPVSPATILLLTPVGDKYVTEELMNLAQKEEGKGMLGLGGEQSGHIILLDEEHRTGDGIRTAVFILKMLAQMPDPSLSALAGSIQKYNQVVASCDVSSKPDLQNLTAFQKRLERLQTDLPGLVQWNSRYSGTEPKYRLMLEADTRHSAGEVAAIAWEICDLIQSLTNTPKGAKIEVLNVTQGGLMPRPE